MSFLPPEDRAYLAEKGIAYEEREENGQKAVILRTWHLPDGHYDIGNADILIILPSNYPDAAPDMFYLLPWAKLARGSYPRAADVPHTFAGQTWQRWSRHESAWRRGVDGIWTMIKRIEHALKIAA